MRLQGDHDDQLKEKLFQTYKLSEVWPNFERSLERSVIHAKSLLKSSFLAQEQPALSGHSSSTKETTTPFWSAKYSTMNAKFSFQFRKS